MTSPTSCADTSLVVAALSSWHGAHEPARRSVDRHRPLLPGHVLLESYATLTRLPGHELAPDVVTEALAASFPDRHPTLPGGDYLPLLRRLAAGGMAGGRVYDALVAAECKAAKARILTLDRRAIPVYELVGCEYEVVA